MSAQAGISAWRAVELRLGRNDPELLLAGEGALALRVPAVVELPGVPVDPLPRHVVRRVGGTRCEVHEERLVRHQRLLLVDPADRPVGEVLGEVVALLGGGWGLHRGGALVQGRVPLVVLPADEAVERLEPTAARRPRVERAHRRGLPDGHLVALAELGGGVPVELQRHRQRRLGIRPQRLFPGADVAVSVMLPIPTEWWLRPVSSACRVGAHNAVVWNRL